LYYFYLTELEKSKTAGLMLLFISRRQINTQKNLVKVATQIKKVVFCLLLEELLICYPDFFHFRPSILNRRQLV
jgi:hypothetical protein